MHISIDVNTAKYIFILKGDIEHALNNRRLLLRFKRLGYYSNENSIEIPFRKETQIKTLEELKRILKKFDFETKLAKNTNVELNSYKREEEQFKAFSENARKIRNDEF